jgi:hypothetical protein
MSGIEYKLAYAALAIPERYRIEAACVIGRIGDPSILDEKQRAREQPSGRRPLGETVFAGSFPQ